MQATHTPHLDPIELELPVSPTSVSQARRSAADFAERRARRSDVELAVSEAVTNCIIHASPERAGGKITLRAEIRGSRLAITVSDDGTGMRPNLASRGLGIGIPLSTVLLYTDGLIERREHDIDVAIERLKQAFASGPEEPAEIVESLPAQFGAEREQDDIALLAARIGVS
ncbi:MAG: ATP-binding protein [Solirubrobacterales bacterium]